LDAWVFGNRITGPDEAVKYAQGQTIKHTLDRCSSKNLLKF